MPAHNRRTGEQPLSNPPRRSVAKRDAPRRAAARKAPDNAAKPGESKSLGLTPTIAHRPHRRIAVRSRAATARAQAQSRPIGGGR